MMRVAAVNTGMPDRPFGFKFLTVFFLFMAFQWSREEGPKGGGA